MNGNRFNRRWRGIPYHYPHTAIDEYVIMPNHVHGIIIMRSPTVGAENFLPLRHRFQHSLPRSLASVIRGFKIGVTAWCRNNGHGNFQWQRNYFERVIRDDDELEHVRAYIRNNPTNWELDEENPSPTSGGRISSQRPRRHLRRMAATTNPHAC